MSIEVIEYELYIGRDNRNIFNIEVTDTNSRTRFLRLSLTAEQFAMAITGLHSSGFEAQVTGLENVGKVKVSERRRVMYRGFDTYDKDILSKWIMDECQEDGWKISPYLGSQKSVQTIDGIKYLNYSVYKFVDKEESK